jgi:anthranilate phosphoribosyltransferase
MRAATTAASAGGLGSFTEILQRLAERRDLSRVEAARAVEQMVDGHVSDVQAAAFLMGLRVKGETSEEIAGLADALRRRALVVETSDPGRLVDIVGTGGDGLGTFNVSTTAAFVAAGAGVRVAKHGNRAASSRCGSADVLEALGVRIDVGPAGIATCIEEVGMGFMLASLHHPASGRVAGVRKMLGVRTVFNFLGPLTNPAKVGRLVLGVSAAEYVDVLAEALARMGCERALVVHGADGMDELSVTGPSTVVEVSGEGVGRPQSLDPETCGLGRYRLEDLAGGSPEENAVITRGVLAGGQGARRDSVLLNAAAALYVAGAASSLREGVDQARLSIDSGRAMDVLDAMVVFTNEPAGRTK